MCVCVSRCADHYTCTTNSAAGECSSSLSGKDCSEEAVSIYTDRYSSVCTGVIPATCEDYAGIHNGGSNGCHATETASFRHQVQQCCAVMFGGEC